MLSITILNDNTGDDEAANYTYLVRANYKVIASGRVLGHARADDWRVLALEAIAPGMLEACELALSELEEFGDWTARELNVCDPDSSRPRRTSETLLIRAIAKVRKDDNG